MTFGLLSRPLIFHRENREIHVIFPVRAEKRYLSKAHIFLQPVAEALKLSYPSYDVLLCAILLISITYYI